MSRAMPSECEHGKIFDWGDFGGEDSKPETCVECEADLAERTIQWCEVHRCSPKPEDADQLTCPLHQWVLEGTGWAEDCRMTSRVLV